jgi:hypothetical protein
VVIRGNQMMVDAGNIQKSLRRIRTAYTQPIRHFSSLTCHFRQLGLKDGLPAAAFPASANTYRLGILEDFGARCGRSLGGYVTRGTWSNSFFTGAGMEKRSRTLRVCRVKAEVSSSLRSPGFVSASFGGIGWAGIAEEV